MKQSLQALLSGIIDYAGMFPPARLSAEETVRNHLRYRRGEHAWMLGKLVWPAGKLEELPPLLKSRRAAGEPAVSVSAAFSAGESTHEFMDRFERFGQVLSEFQHQHQEDIAIGALEIALPAEALARSENAVLLLLEQCVAMGAQRLENRPAMFFEVPGGDDWQRHAEWVIADLGARQSMSRYEQRILGFKLRTGGLTAAAFPSEQRVAWVIAQCREGDVPWKATAGLHHPLRSINDDLGVTMMGFVNVAAATVIDAVHHFDESRLARQGIAANRVHEFDIRQLERVLFEVWPDAFEFRDKGMRHCWASREHRHEVTTEQITAARRDRFLSFGSCSFEEPIEELQKLRLL